MTGDLDAMRAMADEMEASGDLVLAELVRHGLAGRLSWAAVADGWDALDAHDEAPEYVRQWSVGLPLAPEDRLTTEDRERLRPHWQRAHELENTPADWWGGANSAEVRAFGLAICTCGSCPADRDNRPDGSSIPRFTDQRIRELLAVADQRLGDRATRTSWLERYAGLLVTESRSRRGAA